MANSSDKGVNGGRIGRPAGVTALLHEWRAGNEAALHELIPLVYGELRAAGRDLLKGERAAITLQPTALVNEMYLRLVGSSNVQWHDRAHFFAVAAQLMRRVLVDEARRRNSKKRGGELTRVPLYEGIAAAGGADADVLAVDDALLQLAKAAPRKCRVIELRCFGGLTIEETAEVLGVSTDTVKREWRTAHLWLRHQLESAGHGSGSVRSD